MVFLPNLYGLLMATAALVGLLVALKLAGKLGLDRVLVERLFPWLVVFGFVGARIYFVAFSWEYFGSHPGDIVAVWKGGLSIYGAILGGLLAIFIFSWREKVSVIKLVDLVVTALPLGQAIGRWGNYFNREAFGLPTTLPWGIYIPPERRPFDYLGYSHFHPTFLYESILDLLIFFILYSLVSRLSTDSKPGLASGLYFILYGIGRFFIESIRLDSFFVWNFRVDQIVSVLIVFLGIGIISKRYASN